MKTQHCTSAMKKSRKQRLYLFPSFLSRFSNAKMSVKCFPYTLRFNKFLVHKFPTLAHLTFLLLLIALEILITVTGSTPKSEILTIVYTCYIFFNTVNKNIFVAFPTVFRNFLSLSYVKPKKF